MDCEEIKNVSYNYDKKICALSKEYCLQHGADVKETPDGLDCDINVGQNIAENIFGITVTRFMKQVFDPSQYKHCDKDWYDGNDIPEGMKIALGIMILLPPPINIPSIMYFTMGNKLCFSPYGCSKGLDMDAGLCYPKCKENYHGIGPVCWENNKSGWHDIGALIREHCRPGWHEVLGVCWEDNKPGWVDVGALIRQECGGCCPKDVAGWCWNKENNPYGSNYIPPTIPRPSYIPPTVPRPSYGRGVGMIPFQVKFKERLVRIGGN